MNSRPLNVPPSISNRQKTETDGISKDRERLAVSLLVHFSGEQEFSTADNSHTSLRQISSRSAKRVISGYFEVDYFKVEYVGWYDGDRKDSE